MGSKSQYPIAMEINKREGDRPVIDGNDSEEVSASLLRIEAH